MPRVMIIEDEEDLIYLMRTMFEKHGFETLHALNGKSAYDKLSAIDNEDEIPDLLFLDIMMPEMDGYTFYFKLQENDKLKKIPIIILTAKRQMRDVFEFLPNVCAFIEKPFDPQALIKIANNAIAKNTFI
ncbi:MAG: response regulator [Elusimicrobia bacterium]|nr:response regulator [Elusimicrobiota bacterium]